MPATLLPPRRVLILKPCCLGDVLMATPLAAALRAAWPAAEIWWAVDAHSAPALAGNPDLTGIIDASHCIRGDLRPSAVWRLLKVLRTMRFDVAFVPDRAPLLALLPCLAGIPMRIGLDSAGRGWPHTVRVPVPPMRHEIELYLDLARAAELDLPDRRPVFAPSSDDLGVADRLLGSADSAWIAIHPSGGINPGMRLIAKRWPADRFAAIIHRLVTNRPAKVVLLGGPGDQATTNAVLDRLPAEVRAQVLDLTGKLSLGQTAAVIQCSAAYIGNDSGIAHLATAVGTPAVVVFGPTRPERYGPLPALGVSVAPAVDHAPSVAVDRLSDAAGSAAIEAVGVEAVWAALGRVLDESRGSRDLV